MLKWDECEGVGANANAILWTTMVHKFIPSNNTADFAHWMADLHLNMPKNK